MIFTPASFSFSRPAEIIGFIEARFELYKYNYFLTITRSTDQCCSNARNHWQCVIERYIISFHGWIQCRFIEEAQYRAERLIGGVQL